jgi:hypothetical protein
MLVNWPVNTHCTAEHDDHRMKQQSEEFVLHVADKSSLNVA